MNTDREQDMTPSDDPKSKGISHSFLLVIQINVRQREDDCPGRAIHSPPERYKGCGANYHASNDDHRNEDGEPKAGQ
jgi:hypothetical protein